jgi:hypothetical protein
MSMTTTSDIISSGKRFELTASTDRSTFVLLSKTDYFVAHLQGDEATRFDADYTALRRLSPSLDPDQALGRLWDQGGYSWFAAQYAD